jgi:hypothetical protein
MHKPDKLVLRAPNCLGPPKGKEQKFVALMYIMTVKTRNDNNLSSARIIHVDNETRENSPKDIRNCKKFPWVSPDPS